MAYLPPNPNGSATSANSSPVVIASDQASIPVTVAGVATAAAQATLLTELQLKADLTETQPVSAASLPLPAGAATAAAQATLLTELQLKADLTETQPVSLASVPSHPVTNAGTFAVQDSEKIADNGAFVDGTTKVQPVGHIFDEVAGIALTENDIAASRIDSKRAQIGVIEDATTRGQRAAVSAAGALKVDGSAVTQPVSAVALPLPSGASTLAEQQTQTTGIGSLTEVAPATDTASSGLNGRLQRVAQRLTTLITALGSPFQAGGSIGNTTFGATQATAANFNAQVQGAGATGAAKAGNPVQAGGVFNTTQPTVTTGQTIEAQMTARGEQLIAKGVSGFSIDNTTFIANAGTNLNTSALALDATLVTTNTQIGIVTEAAPASDTASAGLNGRLQRIAQRLTSLIALFPTTLGQGTMATSMKVVLPSDQAAIPVTLTSTTITGTPTVNDVASATGGYTPNKLISAATTNATVIKASAGTLGYVQASNINAAARYLKFYNKATAPVVGTDVPVHVWLIPGNTAGAGTNIPIPSEGVNFSAGISFALTAGAADSDVAAVAASEIIVNYGTI